MAGLAWLDAQDSWPWANPELNSSIRRHRSVDRTARNSRSNRRSSHGSQKSSLKRFHIGWIEAHHIGNASGQNIAEEPKAGAKQGIGLKLPRDRRSRLENSQRRRRKYRTETSLYDCVQRLIRIMRNGVEGTMKSSNLSVRIQRVGIERVSKPKGPSQILGQFPRILRVKIQIEEIEWFVRRTRERLCRRRRHAINELRQGGVGHRGNSTLAKVVIIQPEDPYVCAKP